MALEDEFKKAVHDETYRQPFLNRIAYRGLPEYVDVLRYQKKLPQLRKGQEPTMVTILCPQSKTSQILVSKAGFEEELFALDDFRSTLMDHEYVHAQRFFSGQLTDEQTEESIAYKNQINNLWRRKCSIPFVLRLSMLSHIYLPEQQWNEIWKECNIPLHMHPIIAHAGEDITSRIRAQILAFSIDNLTQAIEHWKKEQIET